MKVRWDGSLLFVRVPGFRPGIDKVWCFVTPAVGPVDILGERLMSSNVADLNFQSAWSAGIKLSNGGDESPIVRTMTAYVGGNHLPDIFDYLLTVYVDSVPIPKNVWVGANYLLFREEYKIRENSSGPAIILRTITRSMLSGFLFDFTDRIECMSPFDLWWFSGTQAQKPAMLAGDTLTLQIPGADTNTYGAANGVDITRLNDEVLFADDMWATANPPRHFKQTVKRGGAPQYTLVQGFQPGQFRGDIETACFRSAPGKMYPRGIEFAGGKAMEMGQALSVIGYQGTVNGAG